MKTIKLILVLGLISFGFKAFNEQDQNEWIIPGQDENMTNSEEAFKENIALGKSLYSNHCKSINGKKEYGDGLKSEKVDGAILQTSPKMNFKLDLMMLYFKKVTMNEKNMSKGDVWLI